MDMTDHCEYILAGASTWMKDERTCMVLMPSCRSNRLNGEDHRSKASAGRHFSRVNSVSPRTVFSAWTGFSALLHCPTCKTCKTQWTMFTSCYRNFALLQCCCWKIYAAAILACWKSALVPVLTCLKLMLLQFCVRKGFMHRVCRVVSERHARRSNLWVRLMHSVCDTLRQQHRDVR